MGIYDMSLDFDPKLTAELTEIEAELTAAMTNSLAESEASMSEAERGAFQAEKQKLIDDVKAMMSATFQLSNASAQASAPVAPAPSKETLEFIASLERSLRHKNSLRSAVQKLHSTSSKRIRFTESDLQRFDAAIEKARKGMSEIAGKFYDKWTVASVEQSDMIIRHFEEDEQLFRDTLAKYRQGEPLGEYKAANPWRNYNPYSSYT